MENKQRLTGLTAAEVIERRENGLSNVSSQKAGKSVKEIVISNTFTYFNFIFLIITVLLCIVGSFRNLTFLPIVIGNTLVGIVQEIRAKKTIDKMNLLNAPHAVAIRDGQRIKLRSEELVKDDIVIFYSGNQICADAKVLKGSVTVNEALLTGEEDEITKNAGDRLLSGSFIVSGECLAVLENVGDSSYISKLTAEAKSQQDGEQSEMIKAINKIVKWMGIILIPIGGVLFYQSFFVKHLAFKSSVVSTVAAVIGMIPEG
ncbi:MAG TPA: ATPase P, partial [Ruminococcaceae bacterium]|nr:ATPase P [Oscillospiraceae bacterium]